LRGEEKDMVKNVKALVLKAQCLSRQKNFDEALEVIEEVVVHTRAKKMGKI
jgi:hypothetical protein